MLLSSVPVWSWSWTELCLNPDFYHPPPTRTRRLLKNCGFMVVWVLSKISIGHPVRPRSRCHREICLVLTSFLTPTPTPTICVEETNLVPEPRRTICLMFDSRRESEADSCLISSEIVLLEPQICRQYCRQLSVFSNSANQSQPVRSDDRNSAPKMAWREKYETVFSRVAGYR